MYSSSSVVPWVLKGNWVWSRLICAYFMGVERVKNGFFIVWWEHHFGWKHCVILIAANTHEVGLRVWYDTLLVTRCVQTSWHIKHALIDWCWRTVFRLLNVRTGRWSLCVHSKHLIRRQVLIVVLVKHESRRLHSMNLSRIVLYLEWWHLLGEWIVDILIILEAAV